MSTSESENSSGRVPKSMRRRLYQSPGTDSTRAPMGTEAVVAMPAVAGDVLPVAPASAAGARDDGAADIIRRHVLWSAAAGVVPIPLLDAGLVSWAQLAMIRELAALYEVPFCDIRARSIATALVGGLGSALAARVAASRLFRSIPGIGPLLSVLALPAFAGACTYALGMVFAAHFAKGATLAELHPADVRDYFVRKFHEGRSRIRSMIGPHA